MRRYLTVLLIIVSVGVAACSGKDASQKPTSGPLTKTDGSKKNIIKPVVVPEEQKKPAYLITGVRDPFQPFVSAATDDEAKKNITDPLQRLTLSQIGLVGVIMGKEKRALIQESSGMGYILKEGTLVGENSGIVTGITASGVTIKQHFKDYMGRVNTHEIVLSLKKEEGVTGK